MTEKWEYYDLYIRWIEEKGEWATKWEDEERRAPSISELFNPLGEEEWELVSLVSEAQTESSHREFPLSPHYIVSGWDSTSFRAVFKRRKI